MNRILEFEGFCPMLQKEYSITVDYLDASSFDNPNHFIRGLADCDYSAFNPCSYAAECPLLSKAPKEMRF